jgi:hypothetical protein
MSDPRNPAESPSEKNQALPCHQCNCQNFSDPDNDGLCDNFNQSGGGGNRCQHPIETHF